MIAAVVFALASWKVVHARNLLERLHTYDLQHYDIRAVQTAGGLDVDCRIRLRIRRPGPIHLLLTPHVRDLAAEADSRPIPTVLGAGQLGAFQRLLRGLGQLPAESPTLLRLDVPDAKAGSEMTVRVSYLWTPPARGMAYADRDGVQTHLTSFWLPNMAEELFTADLAVRPLYESSSVLASGRDLGIADGWRRFRTESPLQLLSLFVGDVVVSASAADCGLAVASPRDLDDATRKRVLADLEQVWKTLESWFGSAPDERFTLVIEPRRRFAPSFCAGSYAVVDRGALGRKRSAWLSHLAHECSHVWWGWKVPTTAIGDGGTWLREGLAEWTGIRVAATIDGGETGAELFDRAWRIYLGRADVRRARRDRGVVYANEATLIDATYVDSPRVPYLRGALVFRRLEHVLGDQAFRLRLRAYAAARGGKLTRLPDFLAVLDPSGEGAAMAEVSYYAGTSRLPDFALSISQDGTAVRGTVTCSDRSCPAGSATVRIFQGEAFQDVRVGLNRGQGRFEWTGAEPPTRIELDPGRLLLDPVRANNRWSR